MRKFLSFMLLFILFLNVNSQELNCTISINADKIPGSNKQIFKTLENSLSEFVSQKRWTNFNYKPQERINCNLTLTILEHKGTEMKGHIQIQSSRPVYNSTYLTPIFNFKDDNFSFNYTEFEPLLFNENSFESNLISIVSFYIYTIIGLDADTFELNAGTSFFEKAQDVVVQAQQSGNKGWNQNDGAKTRFVLIDNILSPTYSTYREALYNYHLKGLDVMSADKEKAKQEISKAIISLKTIFDVKPSAFLLRIFMDSKSDEIVDVFSNGPRFNASKLKENLLQISSINASKWNKIK